jgi:hypothetical protein
MYADLSMQADLLRRRLLEKNRRGQLQRRELADEGGGDERVISIALACRDVRRQRDLLSATVRSATKRTRCIADLLLGLTSGTQRRGASGCASSICGTSEGALSGTTSGFYRIYCELELNLRIKPRRRLKREKPEELAVPDAPNVVWSMDFMADRLADGRQFRLLNVLDDFNREGPGHRGRLLAARRTGGPSLPEPDHRMASSTFKSRNCRPSARRSAMKSIDQITFRAALPIKTSTNCGDGFCRTLQRDVVDLRPLCGR